MRKQTRDPAARHSIAGDGNDTSLDDMSLRDDILRGAKAISEFTGEPYRRVYTLAEQKRAPIGKEGNILISSKSRLRAHYNKIISGEG
jgi:hypothetical protein